VSEHQDNVFRAVQRLFALYERGNDLERAGAYARALVRLPIDRLEQAIVWAEQTWEEKSPPPVPCLLRAAWKDSPPPTDTPSMRAAEAAESERLKQLRYHLERFSMPDWYEFRRAFGYPVSAQLYVKLGVPVPHGVTFEPPDPAWCKAERERARSDCRAAFRRLEAKQHSRPLEPELRGEVPF
jgi:hypothetical protein